NFGGDAGPNLSVSGFKDPNQLNFGAVPGDHTLSNWIIQHFRSPASTVAGSQMPALDLSEEQIDLLTLYTLSMRRRTLPDVFLPTDRVQDMRFGIREFRNDGQTLYTATCSACHGADGKGARFTGLIPNPSITSPEFLQLASDDFLFTTIQKGRPGRPMLAWGERVNGFTPDEIRALVAHIRCLGANVQYRPDGMSQIWAQGDVGHGERLYAANCAGCHGKAGEGIEGPALNNPVFLSSVTDTFLFETISLGRSGTLMQGFSQASPVRPTLTRQEIEAIVVYIRTLKLK